jgi:putative lipoprotein (rSAM/lipoprotein system)
MKKAFNFILLGKNIYRKVILLLGAFLGFNTAIVAQYGIIMAEYRIKGIVKSKDSHVPIPKIKVSLFDNTYQNNYSKTNRINDKSYTDSLGRFELVYETGSNPDNMKMIIEAEDEDGKANCGDFLTCEKVILMKQNNKEGKSKYPYESSEIIIEMDHKGKLPIKPVLPEDSIPRQEPPFPKPYINIDSDIIKLKNIDTLSVHQNKNIDYSLLEIKKDNFGDFLIYKKGETTPFTGTAERRDYKGSISNVDNYIKGLRDGISAAYYSSGNIYSVTNYKNGKYEGDNISYYENGKIQLKGKYHNGTRDGVITQYYYNGKINSYEKYKDGIAVDTSTSWYDNGMKMSEYINIKENDYNYLRWDTSGYLMDKGNRHKDITNYILYSRYKTGQKKSEAFLVNNQMNNSFTIWYESGAIKEIIHYKNGEWNGTWTDYDINRNIISQGEYKNDKLIKGDQMHMIVEF